MVNLYKSAKSISKCITNSDRANFIKKWLGINGIDYRVETITDFDPIYGNENIIVSSGNGNPLICAHYDVVLIGGRAAPGVNDNGSGVACLMWLINHYILNGPGGLDFAFFGGEELGYVGSDFYCDELKVKPKWVLNLDTCGLCDNLGVSIPLIIGEFGGVETTEWMTKSLIDITIDNGLNFCTGDVTAYGDHLPFLWRDIDSATIQGQDLKYYGLNEKYEYDDDIIGVMHTVNDLEVDNFFMCKIVEITKSFIDKHIQ